MTAEQEQLFTPEWIAKHGLKIDSEAAEQFIKGTWGLASQLEHDGQLVLVRTQLRAPTSDIVLGEQCWLIPAKLLDTNALSQMVQAAANDGAKVEATLTDGRTIQIAPEDLFDLDDDEFDGDPDDEEED